jgi:long-subunit acyl-CoA synthetase (AMP-forming)
VSVPLSVKATTAEIDYLLQDAQPDVIVTQPSYRNRFTESSLENIPLIVLEENSLNAKTIQRYQLFEGH